MTVDIHELKRLNPIEDVIQEHGKFKLNLRASTRHARAVGLPDGEGGFVVDVDKQYYYWNSKGRCGSVIDYLINEHGLTLRQAIEALCRRAGVELHMSEVQLRAIQAKREREDVLTVLADYFHQLLLKSQKGMAYCKGRGWTEETVKKEYLGFWDGDVQALRNHLLAKNIPRDHPVAVAVTGFKGDVMAWGQRHKVHIYEKWIQWGRIYGLRADYLVYTQMVGQRCEYFAARAVDDVEDKLKHWKPRVELVGEQLPFYNSVVNRRSQYIVVVEGQADVVSMGQWGIPAVAIGGLATPDQLIAQLKHYDTLYVAPDGDKAGMESLAPNRPLGRLVQERGPLTHIVGWPEGKDANDLLKDGIKIDDIGVLLEHSPIYAVYLADKVAEASPLARDQVRDVALKNIASMSEVHYISYRQELARAMQISQTNLTKMVKAVQKKEVERSEREKQNSFKETRYMAGGYKDGLLFEMIYKPDEKETCFVVRDKDGRISEKKSLEFPEYYVVPYPATDPYIEKQSLLLASGLEDYGSQRDLIDVIQGFLHQYMDIPEQMERLAAYYAILTWMADMFRSLPYFRALGETGSGKTRVIEVLGLVCYRTMFTTGNSSYSAIFRMIDSFKMITLVMDEAEFRQSDATNDLVKLFNTSNNPRFGVWRTEQTEDGRLVPRTFESYGPKVISQRQPFGDEATNSRCLTVEMNGSIPHPRVPIVMPKDADLQAELIRNMLLKYRMDNWTEEEILEQDPNPKLPGRLRQILFPIKALAPELSEELDAYMLEVMKQTTLDWRNKLEAKVVYALMRCYYACEGDHLEDGTDKLSTKFITDETNRVIDRENARSKNNEEGNKENQKAISLQRVTRILRYKLNLKSTRGAGKGRLAVVVWDEERIESLAVRYGYDEEWFAYKNKEKKPKQGALSL